MQSYYYMNYIILIYMMMMELKLFYLILMLKFKLFTIKKKWMI